MISKRFITLSGLAVAAACQAASAATAVPAEYFFSRAAYENPVLSPSGRYLAMRTAKAESGRFELAVYDTQKQTLQIVARFPTLDIVNYLWVSDERLLFDSDESRLALDGRVRGPGLWAVNADGSNTLQLAKLTPGENQPLLAPNTFMFGPADEQRGDWAYVRSTGNQGHYPRLALLRLNTVTHEAQRVSLPLNTRQLILDDADQPRFATTRGEDEPIASYHVRGQNDAWSQVTSFNAYQLDKIRFAPLAATRDGMMYVVSRKDGDLTAVYTYDSTTNKLSDKAAVKLERHDFNGTLVVNDGKLRGVRYTADEEGTMWLDPKYKEVQAEVDKLLPNTVNRLQFARRADANNVLVTAYSDVQPDVLWLYNIGSKRLQPIVRTRPLIKPEQMGEQGIVRYAARDGAQIPALLTMPAAGKRQQMPLVVLVHDGPWTRGAYWGWSAQQQFLASRGYAVLEPDYRGSDGYGARHLEAGFRQWGGRMQQDVADGVKWAIAQGYADPKRICIAGGGYGGYSALMGVVNDPAMFQCAISWSAMTDLNMLLNGHWMYRDNISENWKKYSMADLVGDPAKDSAQLTEASPLTHAAQIKVPLLLAHGGDDMTVPIVHGTKLRDAVKRANGRVEWVEYEKEGHGFAVPANRIDLWNKIEKFLDKHIGAGAKTE